MKKNEGTEPSKFVAYTYVLIQAVILGLLIFVNISSGLKIKEFSLIGDVLKGIGIVSILISAFSIRKSLTVMPIPKEHGQLAINGLYKYVRHPMYTSVLIFSLGLALSSGEIYKYMLVIGLTLLFYYKSVYEEKFLIRKYAGYDKYAKNTPRFVPRIKA
jgi:protein-S-isoprenylcysteine O-methyltransferase Ste14